MEFVVYRVEAGFPEGVSYTPKMFLMERVIELGKSCIETGDHPVGALIVNDAGVILSESQNVVHAHDSPLNHAEFNGITLAARKHGREGLRNGVLYTTHECCPMCAGAVANSKLAGVVFSTSVEDITELLDQRAGMKWRSNRVRMARILAGRVEKNVQQQFIIGGFMRDQGLALLERAAELAA